MSTPNFNVKKTKTFFSKKEIQILYTVKTIDQYHRFIKNREVEAIEVKGYVYDKKY